MWRRPGSHSSITSARRTLNAAGSQRLHRMQKNPFLPPFATLTQRTTRDWSESQNPPESNLPILVSELAPGPSSSSSQPPTPHADSVEPVTDEGTSRWAMSIEDLEATDHDILKYSDDADEMWGAYMAVMDRYNEKYGDAEEELKPAPIRRSLIHRLAHTIARSQDSLRKYHRLQEIIELIKQSGWSVDQSEWNALINAAGKALRSTTLRDYKRALKHYHEYKRPTDLFDAEFEEDEEADLGLEPDIVTYTTLINIAARSNSRTAVRHASSLLAASNLTPNKITHMALLPHRVRVDGLVGAREIFELLERNGEEMGIDMLNAFLWVHARAGLFNTAFEIYRILKQNIKRLEYQSNSSKGEGSSGHYDFVAGVRIPRTLVPDEKTYTMMIQALAYYGRFTSALEVWSDMLSVGRRHPARPPPPNGEESRPTFKPSYAQFRALFCGFAKHALPPSDTRMHKDNTPKEPWILSNMDYLFDEFLLLDNYEDMLHGTDPIPRISARTAMWIMRSYHILTANDVEKMKRVWTALFQRYDVRKDLRLREVEKELFPPRHSIPD